MKTWPKNTVVIFSISLLVFIGALIGPQNGFAEPPKKSDKTQTVTGATDTGQQLREEAEAGDLARVQALIAAKVNVNSKGKDGVTALMLAAKEGHIKVVEALIAAKADVK